MKFLFARFLVFTLAAHLLISQASAQLVKIPDPNLREAIQEALQLPPDTDITQQQMLELTRLAVWNRGITDLTGLQHATNLRHLSLRYNQITDIAPLATLINLKELMLDRNPITDLNPLSNLVNLVKLRLHGCIYITDISPLANLINLEKLYIRQLPISDYSPLDGLSLIELHRDYPCEFVEIPDPNLEKAIREELQLSDGNSITPQQMLRLTRLTAIRSEIADLTGLECATNLESLGIWGNRIVNLTPLANLTELKRLYLSGNQVVDITPLARLTQLEDLNLGWNRVIDISVLANLTQLKYLRLTANPIMDYSPLDGLSLTELHRDYLCELPPLPIEPRLQNRTFPSVFAAWQAGLAKNLPQLSWTENQALHDLHWGSAPFGFRSVIIDEGARPFINLVEEQKHRNELFALNPNMIIIASVKFRDGWIDYYPEDFPYWLRDSDDNPIPGWPGTFLIDFTQPGMQDRVVKSAVAIAKCGLYDGIFLDWFAETGNPLANPYVDSPSLEEVQRAKDTILQRIRDAVRDDFLIIANYNRRKIVHRAWGINGSFMEVGLDHPNGYTHDELKRIENSLLWNEQNLRAPQVNCLEGWGITTEPPDSPNNKRYMRVFTTMSLTCSDGYVLYNISNHHDHIWHSFWDANLGRPIGPKALRYQDIDGLYIREFTNGWAVYNRSGQPQTITLPEAATPVSDRGSNAASLTHLLPDLDGEIYLTTKSFADVNADGKVNILDLVQVANSIGKSTPDPNGDGVVNILDLVFVTQQFSQ